MDNLSATALAARKAGMSYGKYVALYGICNLDKPIVADEPMKVCKQCGKKFPSKSRKYNAVYCSEECREEANRKAMSESYHKQKKSMGVGNG